MLLILGGVALKQLPVSLLPAIDVPQMIIRVSYPNAPATAVEEYALKPLRESLLAVDGIQDVSSRSGNHEGWINLRFAYNTPMNLAFIAVNEKIDRSIDHLPPDLPRPQVIRTNTADIPILRLQVIPKMPEKYLEVAALTEKVLKKRIEQIEGVSLVDLNGQRKQLLALTPKSGMLKALGLDEAALTNTIQGANHELSNLSVRNGPYRYFVKLANQLNQPEDLERLPVSSPGGVIALGRLATIEPVVDSPTGYHTYNGQAGLVLTIQKQPQAQMNRLMPKLYAVVEDFRQAYPQADFALTQDQSFLLQAGIDNLNQDLIYGGILAVLVLFLFLGNYRSPSLMSISIPVSLIITLVFFWVFGISLNIISLSGLALGIGMLIDNSIVVLDHMMRQRHQGYSVLESCSRGVGEVAGPVISQVLTTVAVYAPLVLLNGLAGALIYDQAIALTISLGVSLLVAFVLIPTLYHRFFVRSTTSWSEDTWIFQAVARGYHHLIAVVFRFPKLTLLLTALLMAVGLWLLVQSPVTALPPIEQRETSLYLDWNEPIEAAENLRRIQELDAEIAKGSSVREAEIGLRQFLLQNEINRTSQAELYYSCTTAGQRAILDRQISDWLRKHYPQCQFEMGPAPNAFTQLFQPREPYFEAKIRPSQAEFGPDFPAQLQQQWPTLRRLGAEKGLGLREEPQLVLTLNPKKLATYGVSPNQVRASLNRIFGEATLSEIKGFGEKTPIRYTPPPDRHWESQLATPVVNSNDQAYPLSTFVQAHYNLQFQYLTADKGGRYQSIIFQNPELDYSQLQKKLTQWARKNDFVVDFSGRYFETRQNLQVLGQIFLLSLVLLYFILAVQFESLVQPILVMLTLPLGIFGAMLLLYLNGVAIDVMAAIGFVVVLGIIVDDPILKVATINRLLKQYTAAGFEPLTALEKAIFDAGDVCLKPLLLTSLTTSLALIPILFTSGIGADLQKSLVYVIVGGLTIGTFFTTCFVPLVYWLVARRSRVFRPEDPKVAA